MYAKFNTDVFIFKYWAMKCPVNNRLRHMDGKLYEL